MTLSPCTDLSAAAWVTSDDQPWEQLVTFGPWGFDAYARLRFLPDPLHDGQRENDVQVDGGALVEHDLLRTTLDVLEYHTQTTDDCYFCLWDGWPLAGRDAAPPLPRMAPAFPPSVLNGPKVVIPNRAYFLFRGGLADFGDWGVADLWPGRPRDDVPPPAFIWPADHAWCVANDVDPHFAGIGADTAAVGRLLADPRIDVVNADPRVEQPHYL